MDGIGTQFAINFTLISITAYLAYRVSKYNEVLSLLGALVMWVLGVTHLIHITVTVMNNWDKIGG